MHPKNTKRVKLSSGLFWWVINHNCMVFILKSLLKGRSSSHCRRQMNFYALTLSHSLTGCHWRPCASVSGDAHLRYWAEALKHQSASIPYGYGVVSGKPSHIPALFTNNSRSQQTELLPRHRHSDDSARTNRYIVIAHAKSPVLTRRYYRMRPWYVPKTYT